MHDKESVYVGCALDRTIKYNFHNNETLYFPIQSETKIKINAFFYCKVKYCDCIHKLKVGYPGVYSSPGYCKELFYVATKLGQGK